MSNEQRTVYITVSTDDWNGRNEGWDSFSLTSRVTVEIKVTSEQHKQLAEAAAVTKTTIQELLEPYAHKWWTTHEGTPVEQMIAEVTA